ncbi:MAG: DUF1013 domain-containing protein [Proteobacteria bacterium]|nr:DUF1013 domain-containing protein [Pseudomonadota bacterium]
MDENHNRPLMPKGTAVWLIEHTSLTFEQIAEFCDLHPLEVQGIADGEVARGVIGEDPVKSKQLTKEEIARCEHDSNARLQLSEEAKRIIKARGKPVKAKYTPIARRQDKPDAIAWLLKNCPEMSDTQIAKLIGTTRNMIESIRSRTHWNMNNIKPKDPVLLGLCSQVELDKVHTIAKARAEAMASKERSELDKTIAELDL